MAAWLAWAAAVALAGAAVALDLRPTVGDWWLNLPLAVGYPLAGAIILTSRSGHPIGRLMIVIGLASALALATHQYATRAIVLEPGSLPFATAAAWLGTWLWTLGAMPAMTLLPLLFPDGRLLSRRWRPVLAAAVLAMGFAAIGYGLAPGRLADFPSVHNPVGVRHLGPLIRLLQDLFFPLALVATAGAVASLVMRWRRAGETDRRDLNRVVVAIVVFVAVVVVAGLLPLPLAVSATVQIIAALLVPAAIVVGVLSRQLFDISVVVRPSLIYAALTGSVLTVYVAVVQVVGRLAGDAAGLVLATGVVAIVFQPLHGRVQSGVDRLLHGDRGDPTAAVSRLAGHLAAVSSPATLLSAAATGVGEALAVAGVRVTAIDGTQTVGTALWGVLDNDVEHVPVSFYDTVVGHLEVAQREPHTPLARADHDIVARLVPHVATAMHIVILTADLTAARERAVLVREEERRRIRRDLHDGFGPVLAGLGLGLEGVADIVGTDPERARSVLAELAITVHTTIDDVRRLVYQLRPPVLDDLGLLGSLREHANSIGRRGGFVVSVDAPSDLPPLPAAVEVAIYRIAVEALTNIERHAHADHCTVRLVIDDGIELTVADDGVGLNGRGSGVGLASMRERVRELNGLFSIESHEQTGTRMRARLPLHTP